MYICNVQKYSCDLCSEVTKVKERRCNHVSPAQDAIMPQTPNHHPDHNQKAKENKGKSNSTSKSIFIAIAQLCQHWAFSNEILKKFIFA